MFESPGEIDPDRIESEEEIDIGILMVEGLIKAKTKEIQELD